MELVKCTLVDGRVVYVNPSKILFVYEGSNGTTTVTLTGVDQDLFLDATSIDILVERFNVVLRKQNA